MNTSGAISSTGEAHAHQLNSVRKRLKGNELPRYIPRSMRHTATDLCIPRLSRARRTVDRFLEDHPDRQITAYAFTPVQAFAADNRSNEQTARCPLEALPYPFPSITYTTQRSSSLVCFIIVKSCWVASVNITTGNRDYRYSRTDLGFATLRPNLLPKAAVPSSFPAAHPLIFRFLLRRL